MRPAIVLLDYGPIARAITAGVSPQQIQPLLVELKRRSAALKDAGYLVLNAANVDGAPSELVIGLTGDEEVRLRSASTADVSAPTAPASKAADGGTALSPAEASELLSDLFGTGVGR